jgi:hypothetical protein
MAGGSRLARAAAGVKALAATTVRTGLRGWRGLRMDHGRSGKHKWVFDEVGNELHCVICGRSWSGYLNDGHPRITKSQVKTLRVIERYPGISAKGVARVLCIGFNRISGRVTELSKLGLIEPNGSARSWSGRKVVLWKKR